MSQTNIKSIIINFVPHLCLLLILGGCASQFAENIDFALKAYDTVVTDDGVTIDEAKIIAKKTLIEKEFVRIFDMMKPIEEKEVTELPDYQKYWFIYFEELDKTITRYIFMVVIDKQTGKVRFADDYAKGNEWMLEAGILKIN